MSEKDDLKDLLREMLGQAVADDYVRQLVDAIADEVREDLVAAADPVYSVGDVRLAIGRVLLDRLGVEV